MLESGKTVIFSDDECKTDLHSNAREYAKTPVRERKNARYTRNMVKFGGGHIMM